MFSRFATAIFYHIPGVNKITTTCEIKVKFSLTNKNQAPYRHVHNNYKPGGKETVF